MVVTSALGVAFILLVLVLAERRFLLPGIIIIGSFILCVLWLTGLIETSLQLYGIVGDVNANCQIYVENNKSWGNNINTLAWLTQSTICEFLSTLAYRYTLCIVFITDLFFRQLLEDCFCFGTCQYYLLFMDDRYVLAG
jgi:hypothetical protein